VGTGAEEPRHYRAGEVLDRVEEHGDLLADLLTPGPEVPA
jgi:bifunctional non-homologous end joining protein LigD